MQETIQEYILEIKDLYVEVDNKPIIKGLNLKIKPGEIHALMGPNGSGKSTLSYALSGHPKYKITKGSILYKGNDLLKLKADERSKLGLFLAFQYPFEIQGVNMQSFLYTIAKTKNKELSPFEFRKQLINEIKKLDYNEDFLKRQLNVGFSGGEKKRSEILQMLLLKPELAILDETDSGLDVDSLKIVSSAVNSLKNKDSSCLVITHYPRILNYLNPDVVHIMVDGKIVLTGSEELSHKIESKGYEWVGGKDE